MRELAAWSPEACIRAWEEVQSQKPPNQRRPLPRKPEVGEDASLEERNAAAQEVYSQEGKVHTFAQIVWGLSAAVRAERFRVFSHPRALVILEPRHMSGQLSAESHLVAQVADEATRSSALTGGGLVPPSPIGEERVPRA